MNEFKEAKVRLDAIARAKKALQRQMKKKCDWDNPEDVAVTCPRFMYQARLIFSPNLHQFSGALHCYLTNIDPL